MIETLAQVHHDDVIPLVAIAVGGGVTVFWIFCATLDSFSKRKQLERSRREIAAYIAEGSMTPEQGESLLKASPKEVGRCLTRSEPRCRTTCSCSPTSRRRWAKRSSSC